MGGAMIKNLIIIGLFTIVVTQTDIGINDVFNYVELALDKLQEMVYTMKRSV
jgi:hypothetical protein|tara:strand:- start:364 stop:519 length:156 start_codon:yes stop_codon:yes gene_type:complete